MAAFTLGWTIQQGEHEPSAARMRAVSESFRESPYTAICAPTYGVYAGQLEKSFNHVVKTSGVWPVGQLALVADKAKRAQQFDIFIASLQKTDNWRPGVEVLWRVGETLEGAVGRVTECAKEFGVDGYTLLRLPGRRIYHGFRVIYIPEFAYRWDSEPMGRNEAADRFRALACSQRPFSSQSKYFECDVRVIGKENMHQPVLVVRSTDGKSFDEVVGFYRDSLGGA